MRGKYLLLATLMATGIATAEQDLGTITVESSTIVDIDVDKKTEASTVNVIDEQDIEKISPKNINDILQTIPGITADVRANGVVEIHMRGIGQQEFMWEDTGVAVVIDGVPVLQNGGKVSFNMDEIASIKVIKGGASYLYGNTALAGAVVITTKKNRHNTGVEFNLEGGSENYKNIKLRGYTANDTYALDILGSYRGEDGYWYQTENWNKTFGGKFTYFIDDSSDIVFNADISRKYDETSRGSVTGVTAAEENPTAEGVKAWNFDSYTDVDKYYVKYNKDFSNGDNLMVNGYLYDDLYNYVSSPQETAIGEVYTRSTDKEVEQYGIKSEYKGGGDTVAYMIGLDAGKRKLDSTSTTTIDYNSTSRGRTSFYYEGEFTGTETTETRYALYGELKHQVSDKLAITSNLRLDYDKYEYTSDVHDYSDRSHAWEDETKTAETSFTNMSFRIGAAYSINDEDTLFANISSGFRNPTVDQMYAGDLKSSSRQQYENNLNIDTEKTLTFEAGIRGKIFESLSYEASVFITDTDDIIGKAYGTYFSGDEATVYDNVGDARNQGLELTLKSDSRKVWSFDLSYTYLDAYYRSHDPFFVAMEDFDVEYDITDNELPRVPHHKMDLIINYNPTDKWSFMAEVYGQSKYYADETNTVEMDGYAKLNLKATYRPTEDLEIFAKVDNVLDNQYYRTVYLYRDRDEDNDMDAEDASITVDPGRVVYVGMKYKF